MNVVTESEPSNCTIADSTKLDLDPVLYGAASALPAHQTDSPFEEFNDFHDGALVQQAEVKDFKLQCGATLDYATLGYCVYTSNPANDIILVHPALTGTARALIPNVAGSPQGDGWWNNHIGPSKFLDTNRYTIVVVDHLGGNGGSTTGDTLKRAGLHKQITFRDGIELTSQVLADRGVTRLHAIVGGSLGGGQATQWMFQDRIEIGRILEVSGSSRANDAAREYFRAVSDLLWQERTPLEISSTLTASLTDLIETNSRGFEVILTDIQRDLQNLDRNFDEQQALATARKIGFLRFVTPGFYDEKINRAGGGKEAEEKLVTWLHEKGEHFTTRFSANALATLSSMAANFDRIHADAFAEQLAAKNTIFTGYHVDGDCLFPLSHEEGFFEAVREKLPEAQKHLLQSVVVEDTRVGHDRFLNGGFSLDAFLLKSAIHDYHVVNEPRCEASHTGDSLPNDPHAISTTMATWMDVIAYETGEAKNTTPVSTNIVVDRLHTGYPRFKLHPYVVQLNEKMKKEHLTAGTDRECLTFPTLEAAQRCCAFMAQRSERDDQQIQQVENSRVHAVFFHKQDLPVAKQYWQHAGAVVSSRLAEDLLRGKPIKTTALASDALRQRLSDLAGPRASKDAIHLFPSGMAAAHGALRVAAEFEKVHGPSAGGRPTLMFGYPYVDNHLLQERSPLGVRAFFRADERELEEALRCIREGEVSAVVTEAARNPGLGIAPLEELSLTCRAAGIPFLVDDTVGGFYNIDVTPYADAIYTSLSKSLCGTGTALGGSLLFSGRSLLYDELQFYARRNFEDMCHAPDLEVILNGAQSYEQRMEQVNHSALMLAKYLHEHPAVKRVYYPYFEDRKNYDDVRKPNGGYGGLLSVALRNETRNASLFYDRLKLNKGPGLGTHFTTACPINLLTHFHELDTFEQKYGLPPFLIRLSIGSSEDPDVLRMALEEAMEGLH